MQFSHAPNFNYQTGFMYEIIDSVPLTIVAPLFSSQWGLVVGLLNGFLRLGSVTNFVVSPIIYKLRGVKEALWLAAAVATCTILFASLIYLICKDHMRIFVATKLYDQLDGENHFASYDTVSDIENGICTISVHSTESLPIAAERAQVQYLPISLRLTLDIDERSPETNNGSRTNNCAQIQYSPVSLGLALDIDERSTETRNELRTNNFASLNQNVGDISEKIAVEKLEGNENDFRISDDYPIDTEELHSYDKQTFLIGRSITAPTSPCMIGKVLREALPLHLFGYQYYMFLCTGAFLYGAMVPFWFLGSKLLEDCYSLSVAQADALMLFPEGMIAIVSVPIGMLLDKHDISTKVRLRMLSASCALLPASYCLLAWGFHLTTAIVQNPRQLSESSLEAATGQITSHVYVPPVLTMCAIGVAYAVSNSLYWSTIMAILPKGRYLSSSNGLIACSLNILPSIVPPLLVYVNAHGNFSQDFMLLFPLYVLSALGCFATGLSFIASLCTDLAPMPLEKETETILSFRDG